jgi:hypothetical protein
MKIPHVYDIPHPNLSSRPFGLRAMADALLSHVSPVRVFVVAGL